MIVELKKGGTKERVSNNTYMQNRINTITTLKDPKAKSKTKRDGNILKQFNSNFATLEKFQFRVQRKAW